ncbi:MAG: DUF4399 domain-containing protein [Acidobacteria bacterium]|nr:DUF4399 domain-containing protein [Acidobacteriota bacterium]
MLANLRNARLCFSVLALFALGACAAETAPEAPAEDPEPEVSEPAPATPEVFFSTIEDGGSYASPLEIVFAVENFSIVPIEDPLTVRPGEGHYHLAVDVECAAAGEVIVAGNPSYIHFGTGSDNITMQFDSGEHQLCLQVADGEHRVIDGPEHSLLTKAIAITIE